MEGAKSRGHGIGARDLFRLVFPSVFFFRIILLVSHIEEGVYNVVYEESSFHLRVSHRVKIEHVLLLLLPRTNDWCRLHEPQWHNKYCIVPMLSYVARMNDEQASKKNAEVQLFSSKHKKPLQWRIKFTSWVEHHSAWFDSAEMKRHVPEAEMRRCGDVHTRV